MAYEVMDHNHFNAILFGGLFTEYPEISTFPERFWDTFRESV